MKSKSFLAMLALVASLASAVPRAGATPSSARQKALPPRELTRAERWKAMGCLQVFTTQRWKQIDDYPQTYVHATYQLYDADGRYHGKIFNVGPMNEPEKLRLDPGHYVVVARAFKPEAVRVPVVRGEVRIPVTVESGKLTVLHLDRPANRKP